MAENTSIEWTRHSFNPWRGCTKVSAGCANCYAETLSGRNPGVLGVWGPNGTRVVAAESAWREPLKWDRKAKAAGDRHRVFCASLADVFEADDTMPKAARLAVDRARLRLFGLIEKTPNLDWLLLTKRPANILPTIKRAATYDSDHSELLTAWYFGGVTPANVWLGTSVENQAAADERIPELLKVPAAVRFLSVEPLLGPVDLRLGASEGKPTAAEPCRERADLLHWVIVGCESGPDARTCRVEWVRDIVGQCRAAGVPVFVKQLGASVTTRLPDGERWPGGDGLTGHLTFSGDGFGNYHVRGLASKAGDPAEWPADLRVREFPTTEAAHDR